MTEDRRSRIEDGENPPIHRFFLSPILYLLSSILLANSARAATYTVDPTGPLTTITAAARLAAPGDTVQILPGTYHETVWLTRSGTADAPITFAAQTPGTVTIDAAGLPAAVSSNFGTTNWITLKNLTIQNCANPKPDQPAAVTTGEGWKLEDITVDSADGTGVQVWSDKVTLLRVTVKNCGRAGLSGYACSDVLAQDCVTINNNTKGADPDFDGGAGKWMKTDHVTIDGLLSHDNVGPGLWFDYNNTNVLIKNCSIYNNKGLTNPSSGDGIRLELNLGPILIQSNKFHGNTGSHISIQSCRHVTIKNNLFFGSALDIRDWPRGEDYTIRDLNVLNNRFDETRICAHGGTWNVGSAASKQIQFADNTYINSPTPLFTWGDVYHSLDEAKAALGLDK